MREQFFSAFKIFFKQIGLCFFEFTGALTYKDKIRHQKMVAQNFH